VLGWGGVSGVSEIQRSINGRREIRKEKEKTYACQESP